MPGGSRSLPDRPSLRHLKLEAKRRLAAGEFPTLHDAQVAIAREYGLPTWAALKQRVSDTPDSPALDQLRWIIARFQAADQPGWQAPEDDELSQHFDEHFLAAVPPPALIKTISNMAADLRGDPVVLGQTPVQAYIQLQGMHYIAVTEPDPPHRLTALRGLPIGSRVHDPRITEPPVRTQGEVPATVATIAEQAFAELGLTALLLAGGDHHTTQPWILTQGWADLDRKEPLDPAHRFPAPGVTALVTVTAVLRLTADHAVDLDRPANDYLTNITMADDTITVRELLSHTAGVDGPTELNADQVPELPTFLGPVVHASGPRGTVHPSKALAHEALTPQSVPGPGGGRIGLGWIITPRGDVASHAGADLDATATVTTRIRDQRTHVVLTTRMIPVNSIETRLLRAWTNP